jgi:D-xylose transport system substrate-binding protein
VRSALTAVAVAALALASGCGQAPQAGGNGGSSGAAASVEQGFKIGLLLPESKTARYEKFDRPLIEQNIKKLCPKCTIQYLNANQQANTQQQQVDTVLTAGVKVLILDSVNYKSIASSVNKAKQQGVPVVAYDRLAEGPISAYTSFDNENIGKLQGQAFLDAISKGGNPKRGKTVLINGSPDDPNAPLFKKGMHSVLDGKIDLGKEYDTPDWSPDQAQTEAAGAITALGVKNIVGIYAANDGMAGGAIAALKAANANPLPPVTGQDAELAGLQRIVAGDQYATIYKSIKPQAEAAAGFAIALATGKKYDKATSTVKSGTTQNVPAVIVPAVTVTKANIKDTVVKDGYWTAAEICTPQYAAACKAAGLT